MSPRNAALLFLAALLLGGFIYLYEVGEEPGDADTDPPAGRVFSLLVADDIEWIELGTSDGAVAELERKADGWRLVEPMRFPADDVTVEGIATQLAQLEISGRVEGRAAPADFGLADGALVVNFRTGDAQGGLRVGRATPVGSSTYVSRDGSDEVVYVASWRINALRKTLTELRNRQVLEFDNASVRRIRVSWPGTRVELEHREGEWWMTAPVAERADAGSVETMLSDLSFLRADDFVDMAAPDPVALGLDEPTLHVVLHGESEDGEAWNRGVMFGQVIEGRRVVRGTGGALFRVAPERLDDFPRELIAWRVKQLARFAVADARRFELRFAPDANATQESPWTVRGELRSGAWQVEPIPMDARKLRGLVRVLSQLEAVEIVAEEMGDSEREALGLTPPRLGVRVLGEGDTTLAELAIGARAPGRGPLAMRPDRSHVYRIAEEDGLAFPVDRADYVASFGPVGESEDAGGLATPPPHVTDALDDGGASGTIDDESLVP